MGSSYQSNTHPNYNTVVKKNNTTSIRLGEVRDVSRFLVLSEGGANVAGWGYPMDRASFSGFDWHWPGEKKWVALFPISRGFGADQQAHLWPGLHVRPLQIALGQALGLCVRSSVPSRAGTRATTVFQPPDC